jgi:hypothetical protein
MSVQTFLESQGGELAVLIFMAIFISIMAFVMHETGHDPAETGRVLLSNAFTSIMTLLVRRLGAGK